MSGLKRMKTSSPAALETTLSGLVCQGSPKQLRARCPGPLRVARTVQGQRKPQCSFLDGLAELAGSSRNKCPWEMPLGLSLGRRGGRDRNNFRPRNAQLRVSRGMHSHEWGGVKLVGQYQLEVPSCEPQCWSED